MIGEINLFLIEHPLKTKKIGFIMGLLSGVRAKGCGCSDKEPFFCKPKPES